MLLFNGTGNLFISSVDIEISMGTNSNGAYWAVFLSFKSYEVYRLTLDNNLPALLFRIKIFLII